MTTIEEASGEDRGPRIGGAPALSRSRLLGSLGLTAVATGGFIFLVASRSDDILAAAQRVSLSSFLIITTLGLIPLALRSSSWKVAIAGHTPVRFPFAWNVTTLSVLGAFVNVYLGAAVRLVFARRFGPRSLTFANIGVAEAAMAVVEAVIALGLVMAFATRVGLPLSVGVGGFVAAIALLVALHRYGSARFGILRQSAFADRRSLALIGSLLAAAMLVQILRVSLALEAVGLPHSLFTATLAFLAIGILATLPIGPSSFPAAMALVFAGESLDQALAAGLVFLSSSLLAALIAAPPALFLLWRGAHDRRITAAR